MKRVITLLLALVLALGCTTSAFAAASSNSSGFSDVPSRAYYAEAVKWAVNHNPQITNGTSKTTFSPNESCTRIQIVTFLWRMDGEEIVRPTPQRFSDVHPILHDWGFEAVDWAVRNRITNGTSKTTFSPDINCTRAQIVTFLWRYYGGKSGNQSTLPNVTMPFADVQPSAYYAAAVRWAVDNGITSGVDKVHFAPNNECTRAQAVTFLWRAYMNLGTPG